MATGPLRMPGLNWTSRNMLMMHTLRHRRGQPESHQLATHRWSNQDVFHSTTPQIPLTGEMENISADMVRKRKLYIGLKHVFTQDLEPAQITIGWMNCNTALTFSLCQRTLVSVGEKTGPLSTLSLEPLLRSASGREDSAGIRCAGALRGRQVNTSL